MHVCGWELIGMRERVEDWFVMVSCGIACLDNLLSYITMKSYLLFKGKIIEHNQCIDSFPEGVFQILKDYDWKEEYSFETKRL